MGEIHELFVLALSLVWFAGATPDFADLRLRSCALFCVFLRPTAFKTTALGIQTHPHFFPLRMAYRSLKTDQQGGHRRKNLPLKPIVL